LGIDNAPRRREKKFFSLLNVARRIFLHSETEALSPAPVFLFFITHDDEELNKFYTLLKVIYYHYLLFVPINEYIYIYIYIATLNYITDAPTCFGASAPSSGNFILFLLKL
jgi:hypothetical protein